MSVPNPGSLRTDSTPHILVDARFRAQQRGGDRCRFELAAHLAEQAQARYTFLAYEQTRETLTGRLAGDARIVASPYLPNQHPQFDWFENLGLPRLAHRVHADIYHGTFQVLPLLPGACPAVVTLHDMALWAMPEGYGKRFDLMRYLVTAA